MKFTNSGQTVIMGFIILAAIVDMVGSYSMSLVRAMLTCCVPLSDFGKIYSVIAALDNLLPMGLSQAYASVWNVRLTIARVDIYSINKILSSGVGIVRSANCVIATFALFNPLLFSLSFFKEKLFRCH